MLDEKSLIDIGPLITGESLFDPSNLILKPAPGGCINKCYSWFYGAKEGFIKLNHIHNSDIFKKEILGLELLNSSGIETPINLSYIQSCKFACLSMDLIKSSLPNKRFWEDFARQLSLLHKHSSEEFGLDHDNYIGSINQTNRKDKDWVNFFWNNRIEPLLEKAFDQHLIDRNLVLSFERFINESRAIFPIEPPSLLHGDLWSGNFICTTKKELVLIDPAVYFGHREMELAFTCLFGGFDSVFYEAYQNNSPLEKGFWNRKDYYNLYPLLVHLLLFGRSYLNQILSILNPFRV